MNAKVLIQHFRKGEYQGATTGVGVFTMNVKETMEQVWSHMGCESSELTHTMLKTVSIDNRVFVVRETHFNKNICEYEVFLPYDLATNLPLIDCPCCGCKTTKS
jgi:hypothetical protein